MAKALTDSLYTSTDMNDDFEAIFALNMGDFVTEHLISTDLLDKIQHSVNAPPDGLRKQLLELIDIYSLQNTLNLLGLENRETFMLQDTVAKSLADMLEVDACHIFRTVYQGNHLQGLTLCGTSVEGLDGTRWNIGYDMSQADLLVSEACTEGYAMVIPDVSQADPAGWQPLDALQQNRTKALIAVPLMQDFQSCGLILFECYEPREFAQETIDLAEAAATVYGTSMRLQERLDEARDVVGKPTADAGTMRGLRAQLTEMIADLGRCQQFFVETLAYAIDARHNFSQGHAQQVAQLARQLAEAMKLGEKTTDLVYYAGLLGAIGKIDVPRDILNKEEALTPDEKDTLKQSSNMGVRLLMKINFLAEVIPYVDYQKERWDGTNSPHGLSGKSIPLGARIIAVADAYNALTQSRPYRPTPLSSIDAVQILLSESGSKWDPAVIASLEQVVCEQAPPGLSE